MNRFTLAFVGDVEARYPELPWASLDGEALEPEVRLAARQFWSENAFAEYASSIAMADVVGALGRAQIEPVLWRRACAFPADELAHAELCAGVAQRCGGGIDVPFDPCALEQPAYRELLPLERATLLVVRVFCLGEAVSLRLLAGHLRATRQPLARAVLQRIVRDEARHARFGWDYLDWVAPLLGPGERAQLAARVTSELAALAPLTDAPRPAAPASGLGWMPSDRWRVVVRDAIATRLLRPLAARGIA